MLTDNSQRYNTYIKSESAVWISRFTWLGTDGDSAQNHLSVIKFARDTDAFAELSSEMKSSADLYKEVDKLSKRYIKWCKAKDTTLKDTELDDLRNFFKGAVGEYFFMCMLQYLKKFYVSSKMNSHVYSEYTFDHISPRLKNESDYGVDFTGMLSHKDKYYNCVIQVKFWNPNDNTRIITNQIAQSVYSDGLTNDFINKDERNNIIICWLGDTRRVSKWLKLNTGLYKHIVLIDKNMLDKNINSVAGFWVNIYNDFQKIKDFTIRK